MNGDKQDWKVCENDYNNSLDFVPMRFPLGSWPTGKLTNPCMTGKAHCANSAK